VLGRITFALITALAVIFVCKNMGLALMAVIVFAAHVCRQLFVISLDGG
jgi:hypothetical protein